MRQRRVWKLAELGITMLLALSSLWTVVYPLAAWAQSAPAIATTTVQDTVYRADGTTASGTVLITWPAFVTASGQSVPGGNTSVTLGAAGALSVALVSNAGSNPMGSYYTVIYHLDDGTVTREYWVVPTSAASVQVSAIRSTVLPASVAMQTVSKSYVDTAIAAAVAGAPLDATAPYVLKSGDAMTGPLVLPGNPVSPLQASDKAYVDAQVAASGGGSGQKVSEVPTATQIVTQPPGTELAVNILNSVQYASQFVTGSGNNGVANAVASANCTGGCTIVAEQTYPAVEPVVTQKLTSQTHVVDERGGATKESFFNPLNPQATGQNSGYTIDLASTQTSQSVLAATGASVIAATSLAVSNEGLAGGSNAYPSHVQGTVPYFKTTYSALNLTGTENTVGQHVLVPQVQDCYGVGDCLLGGQFLNASGGFRDDADEGSHPYDLQIAEDSRVFEGTCASGCSAGSTLLQVSATANPATQGEGRFLIDKNPGGILSTGLISGSSAGRQPIANFSGTSFPLSTLLETAQTIPTQPNSIAPGTVTVPIVTASVPAGFATSTTALPGTSGVACLSDVQVGDQRSLNFEMAAYTVVDASHLQLTLNRAHANGATIAVGGLCGYGLEQTVDTTAGIRQVFPVIGSTSATSLLYAGGSSALVGVSGLQSAYVNLNLVVASISRAANVVTVTTAGSLPVDVNGLTLNVQGVADSSYNGSFPVTSTGANSLTYPNTGANSTSTGGTLSFVTGGYALYPMAEVLQVYNATTHAVDGQMTLAANTVNWAAGDAVEQPHYFQENVHPDIEYVTQYTPRPTLNQVAGIFYQGNNGPLLTGWQINNTTPVTNYFGNGGTHTAPSVGMSVAGVWHHSMELEAGEDAAIEVHCNSHGCGAWNSGYDLFQMDYASGLDRITYSPATSNLNFSLRGTNFLFTPSGLTAGTLNVGTLNATAVHGAFTGTVAAASLPVFGASGSGHQIGAVPDPGPTAGTTRFLREDGTWDATGAGGTIGAATSSSLGTVQLAPGLTSAVLGSASAQPVTAFAPNNGAGVISAARGSSFAALDTVYDFTDQNGTNVTDRISGNNATLSGSTLPTWTGNGLAFTAGSSVSLPAVLNAEKTFYFAVYLNPITAAAQASNVYPTMMSSSTGGTGLNLVLEAPGGITTGSSDLTYSPTLYPNALSTATPNTLSGFNVLTLVCGTGSGNLDHLYINAVEVSYATQGSNCGAQTGGNLVLGNAGVSPWTSGFFPGTFYGFGASATQHTPAQVQQNVGAFFALASAKGVATTPPAMNIATPQLLAVGDSITAGLNGATPYTSLLNLVNQPAYSITNYGIVGIRLASILSHEANRAAPRCSTSAGPALALLEAGTNDLDSVNSLSPQAVWSSAAAWASVMRKAGCTPFMITMISRSGSGYGSQTMDALKDSYDALILQQAKAAGFAAVLDVAANPLMGADGANASTTYFQAVDHIHPTTAGNTLLAAAVSNGLNAYFGYNEANPHVLTSLSGFTMSCADGYVDLSGLTAGGNIALPDCTGASGATFRINNPQSSFAVTVTADSASHPVNGSSTAVTVPAGGTLALRLVPNPKTTAGWHWEF